jgi:hypothetical protein
MSETVPWTFQINSCRFTRPHILYILSVIVDILILWIDKVGIMNDSFMCVIYAVHFKIANLRRYSIGLPKKELCVEPLLLGQNHHLIGI